MSDITNKGGRPRLSEEQKQRRKDLLLQKVEPYLMTGMSINKALHEAKVFNSEFYKYLAEDRFFGEKIAKFRQYISILVNQAITTELFRIVEKQNSSQMNIKSDPLSKREIDFLCWYAVNANVCTEEWGRRQNILSIDPEEEIQRIKQFIKKN